VSETAQPRIESGRAAELGLPTFEVWDSIGSTNDRARVLAEGGTQRGGLVLAREQTAGRGRRGAWWVSGSGNGVWMSLVLSAADATPQLPIVIGVACAEVLEEHSGVRVLVKWPNDLMIKGRKLGGILVERGSGWVVTGIGINVDSSPSEDELTSDRSAFTPTSLSEHTDAIPSTLTLSGLLARRVLDLLDAPHAVTEALEAFTARDALIDHQVLTQEYGAGIARGIDEDGMLLLELDDGSVVSVRSGSVRPVPRPGLEE